MKGWIYFRWFLLGVLFMLGAVIANLWYNEWEMIQRGQEVSLAGAPAFYA